MEPTPVQANACVREGIRRVLWWSRFSRSAYEVMTVAGLRKELKASLAPEIPSERTRLLHLNVSISRQFRKKGWLVRTPRTPWYLRSGNQRKRLPEIAAEILSRRIDPA